MPVKLRVIAPRAQPNLSNKINAIPLVQSPPAKTFRFVITPNHPYNSRHPVPLRGASAVVTTRGRLRWTRPIPSVFQSSSRSGFQRRNARIPLFSRATCCQLIKLPVVPAMKTVFPTAPK